jgi:hypothetical protein
LFFKKKQCITPACSIASLNPILFNTPPNLNC